MLADKDNLDELVRTISELRQRTERLKELSGGMQCIDRNCDRILAGVQMLELNITDVSEFFD